MKSFIKKIISLDAVTGKEIWELELSDYAPRRGMVYLKGDTNQTSKLFFPSYKNLVSINASDGTYNKKFGNNGKVKLKNPSITAPAIFKDNLIITTSKPSIEVYDLFSGKLKWKFILMKEQKNRNGGKRYDYSGGNPWGGFSLDEARGEILEGHLRFCPTCISTLRGVQQVKWAIGQLGSHNPSAAFQQNLDCLLHKKRVG